MLNRLKDWGIASFINYKFVLLLTAIPLTIISQNFEREIDPFPVSGLGGNLFNVFAGGTNNPEFQFVDIDNDSDADLFILNRDGSFQCFTNIGSKQNPYFKYTSDKFPGLETTDWFYFVDIDADDDYDLFTAKKPNFISYFENVGSSVIGRFEMRIDTLKDSEGNLIFSEGISNPIFADIDADGDYDFFSGTQAGKVIYYENSGTRHSFEFKFVTDYWQGILIIGGGLAKSALHGANSIEFADIDNDNDLDLFWGDFFSRSLYFFENYGTPQNPQMELITDFYPLNSDSLITRGYNMPRFFDIDGDNDLDLFASVLFDATDPHTIIYYENFGNAENPDLRFVTNDFINTLDVGTKSIPSFVDIDGDGDLDMFVGNEQSPKGTIYFYENIGTSTKPVFNMITKKFGNIEHDLSVAQAFGDIDGDGDYDIVVGELLGHVTLYRNIGTTTSPNFINAGRLRDESGNDIKFNNFARPSMIDIDFDNDLDLIIGSSNGDLILYNNIGTSTTYRFNVNTDYFAGIDVGEKSAPSIIDYDKDGDFDLFIGNREGRLIHYINEGSNDNPLFIRSTEKFLEFNFGAESVPHFTDIDSDSDPDLFVGNFNGGLFFFRNSTVTGVESFKNNKNEEVEIVCYPNPFNSQLTIEFEMSQTEQITVSVFNILGELVKELHNGLLLKGKHVVNWFGRNKFNEIVNSGIYFINLQSNSISNSFPVQFLK